MVLDKFSVNVKVIRDRIGFTSHRPVIGLRNRAILSINQSDAKLKLIGTWLPTFSRPFSRLLAYVLSSYWFIVIIIFPLIAFN